MADYFRSMSPESGVESTRDSSPASVEIIEDAEVVIIGQTQTPPSTRPAAPISPAAPRATQPAATPHKLSRAGSKQFKNADKIAAVDAWNATREPRGSRRDWAIAHGINPSTFTKWLASRAYTQRDLLDPEAYTSHRGPKPANTQTLDEKMLAWFKEERKANRPVSRATFIAHLSTRESNIAQQVGVVTTAACQEFYRKFIKAHDLTVRRKTDKRVVTNEAIAAVFAFRQKFMHMLAMRSHDTVINIDETPLWHKQAAQTTLEERGLSRVNIDHCEDRDRITVVLAVARSGRKLKPAIIVRSRKKTDNCVVTNHENYILCQNAKAYNNSDLYVEILKIWVDTGVHAVIHDNVALHLTEAVGRCFDERRVSSMTGPALATEVWQPLDVGIIANFKHHYHTNHATMSREMAATRSSWDNHRTVECVVKSWAQVQASHIQNCWKKALEEPPRREDEIQRIHDIINKIAASEFEDDLDEIEFYTAAADQIRENPDQLMPAVQRVQALTEIRRTQTLNVGTIDGDVDFQLLFSDTTFASDPQFEATLQVTHATQAPRPQPSAETPTPLRPARF